MDMSTKANSEHFLAQVDRLIDWARLAPLLQVISARVQGDAPPAAARMLLLAHWYGMSEGALLEACQDRLSFRRFLGLPPANGADGARLAEVFQATHAAVETQNLIHAIEAQLLARGFAIKPGMSAEAQVVAVPAGPIAAGTGPAVENRALHETTFFQPGEIADLLKQGESVLVRGGARASTSPSYNTGSLALVPLAELETAPLQAVIEWPWGVTTELTERLNIGRDHPFCPFAGELYPYTHVSRRHAELTACSEGVWVRDLRSRNGTFVNDEELPKGQAYLVDTDARIRFGPYCVVLLKLKSR